MTSGELTGVVVDLFRKTHEIEDFLHLLINIALLFLLHFQPERHVLRHAQVRKKRVLLKDHTDPAVARIDIRDVFPLQVDPAGTHLLQASQAAQERALTAS